MPTERQQLIEAYLQDRGFAGLGELAAKLGVSESTVRRDLESIESRGLARRTHGGAFWTGESKSMTLFDDRKDGRWNAKAAIANAAAELIEEGDTILLDGGSTTYELARRLTNRSLQVVTNSLPVAHVLSRGSDIDLVMIGGCVRGRTAVSIGPLAIEQIKQINVQKAFLSIAAANENGFFNSDMMLVESERAMLNAADHITVVADSEKFGKVSLSRICELSGVDRVISDTEIGSKWKTTLHDAGVDLVLSAKENASTTGIPLRNHVDPSFKEVETKR